MSIAQQYQSEKAPVKIVCEKTDFWGIFAADWIKWTLYIQLQLSLKTLQIIKPIYLFFKLSIKYQLKFLLCLRCKTFLFMAITPNIGNWVFSFFKMFFRVFMKLQISRKFILQHYTIKAWNMHPHDDEGIDIFECPLKYYENWTCYKEGPTNTCDRCIWWSTWVCMKYHMSLGLHGWTQPPSFNYELSHDQTNLPTPAMYSVLLHLTMLH